MIQSTISGHERMTISYVSFTSMAMAFGVLFCLLFSLPPFTSSTTTPWIFPPPKALFGLPFEYFDVFTTFPCTRYRIYRLTWWHYHEVLEIYDAPIRLAKVYPLKTYSLYLFVTRDVDFVLVLC